MIKTLLLLILFIGVSLAGQGPWPRSDHSCDGAPDGKPGYYWDGQKCEECQKNCFCSSLNGCNSCPKYYTMVTYTIMTNGKEEIITKCVDCNWGSAIGVEECCIERRMHNAIGDVHEYSIKASKCMEGYRLFGTVCHKHNWCKIYNTYMQCMVCMEGYYLGNNRMCTPCKDGCMKCATWDQCDECKETYYLATNKGKPQAIQSVTEHASLCNSCNTNCLCKVNTNKCTSCKSDSYVYDGENFRCDPCDKEDPDGQLIKGIDFCSTCKTLKTCLSCKPGYIPTADGSKCLKCPDNCNEDFCELLKGAASCKVNGCYNGYYANLIGGGDSRQCDECYSELGYRCKLEGDRKKLTQCIDNTESDTLLKYQSYLQNNTVEECTSEKIFQCFCKKNTNSCKKMVSTGSDNKLIQKCESCYDNWMLNKDKICKKCHDRCKTCILRETEKTDLTCTDCQSGFYKTPGTTNKDKFDVVCKACPQAISSCQTCSSGSVCLTCLSGYYVDGTDKRCKSCNVTDCMTCKKTDECTVCATGFRLFDKNTCLPCAKWCGKCEEDRRICTICKDGYIIVNGVCHKPHAQCILYDANGICAKCTYGHRQVNGWCLKDSSQLFGFENSKDKCEIIITTTHSVILYNAIGLVFAVTAIVLI